MSSTAKVFMNGRSQAIRLPKEFRVSASEVRLVVCPAASSSAKPIHGLGSRKAAMA